MVHLRAPQTLLELVHELTRLVRSPALLVWTLFVLLVPVYVFASGLPQPGDALILPLVPLVLAGWNGRLSPVLARPVRALALFTLWALLVNWAWAVIMGNFGLFGKGTFLLFPIYYVYNTLIFLAMCILYQRYGVRFLWLTLNAVFFSVLIQVVGTFVINRSFGVRGMGFFNNPNQLGFFALVSASMITVGRRRLGFGPLKAGIGLTACLYLALLSASRAAVLGIGVLFVLTMISQPKYVFAAVVVIVGVFAIGGPVADAIDGTQQRLTENRYPQYTFFEERGYDRILANKQYWLLGAGEGGTQRFATTTAFGTPEIHSSFGTVFFSYGLLGLILFVGFLYRVTQGGSMTSTLILLPMLAYMVAHQGLRSTSVWIFLAITVALKHLDRTRARAARSRGAPPVQIPAPTVVHRAGT